MEKYIFYDTDPTGHEEYDISGEQYHALLQALSSIEPFGIGWLQKYFL